MRQRPGDQPLPEVSERMSVQDIVLAEIPNYGWSCQAELADLIRKRRELGIERYGTALQPFNGRDVMRDLLEELVDAAMYARQWLEELGGSNAEAHNRNPHLWGIAYHRYTECLGGASVILALIGERDAAAAVGER